MRWIFLGLGITSFIVGILAFFISSNEHSNDSSQSAIREAIKAQSKSMSQEFELHLNNQAKKIQDFIQLYTEKKGKPPVPSNFEPIYIVWKQQNVTQDWKAKAANVNYIKTIASGLLTSADKITFREDKDKKPYIFLSLQFTDTTVVAAYRQEQIFAKFGVGSALSLWAALQNGNIIFHNNTRYLGTAAGNVRSVAVGTENIRRGIRSEMFAQYVGLAGKKILGAWNTIPEWGIVIGCEWPSLEDKNSKISLITWAAFVGLVLGAFFVGVSIVPAPIQVTAAQKEIKDLSNEARLFIKKAEKQAEKAFEYARDRENELGVLEDKAREKLAYAERTRWIFEKTENFLEEIIDAKDETIVWPTLASYLSEMALQSTVLIYTYSTSSCSLVPQSQKRIESFPDSAQRYLQEARFLMGEMQNIYKLESTSAFQTWLDRLQKFMPMNEYKLYTVPFVSTTGTRGIALFLFQSESMSENEIEKQKDLWGLFAFRAAWLYDMKKRLLQSKYGKKSRNEKVAFSTDGSSNLRKPTEEKLL